MTDVYADLLVIGAGAAGSTAATTAARAGRLVVMVERSAIGGTCLNDGCDPTKTLLFIAERLYSAQHAKRYGLHIPTVEAKWDEVQAYVQQRLNTIRGGTSDEASQHLEKQGVKVLLGEARFISPHEVVVLNGQGEYTVYAERVILAPGCETIIPDVEGITDTDFISNSEAVDLPVLPRQLAIVGGGAIGIEFAQMFHRFGVKVTVLEHGSILLDKEDREVATHLIESLTQEGIHFKTGIELLRLDKVEWKKQLTFRNSDGVVEVLVVDEILLSIGRKPALERLNLDVAGVETTKKGITVDETLRTNVPHIWAAGDATGGLQFTHLASEQGKLVAQNAFAEHPRSFGKPVIPWVTYTDPPLAHVGKTEEELQQEGVEYRVGRMPFAEVERAISQDETQGFVKLLADTDGKILGGHILGIRADDLLAPIVVAMQAGLTASDLAATILPYPTLGEAVRHAAEKI